MQGNIGQGSSLPHPGASSSPKLQPGVCCAGKSTQLLQRKPVRRQMRWQRSKKGVCGGLIETDGNFLEQVAEPRQPRVGKAPSRWLTLPTSCVG